MKFQKLNSFVTVLTSFLHYLVKSSFVENHPLVRAARFLATRENYERMLNNAINFAMYSVRPVHSLKALYTVGASDVPVTFTVQDPAVGLGDIIKAGLGFLFVGVFAIVILAVLGQFGTIASIWPSANVTKITTNIANSVVTGSAFLSILVVLIMVGFVFVVIGLLQALIA